MVLAVAGLSTAAMTPRVLPIGTSDLIGVWHAAPVKSSGWNDAFVFFEDGLYAFQRSQMACDARDLAQKGTWSLSNDTLKLTALYQVKLVGGFPVKASSSCTTEFMIEGGEIVTDTLQKPAVTLMMLRSFRFSAQAQKPQVMIGGRPFWKFSNDPAEYYR